MTPPSPLEAPSSHPKLRILGPLHAVFSLENSGKHKGHSISLGVLVPGLAWATMSMGAQVLPQDQPDPYSSSWRARLAADLAAF